MTADAFYETLIKPIEKQMIKTASRIVRNSDDAAEVFQEVLVEIWAKLARIERHPNPQAYILRICIMRSYDFLRKRYKQQRNEIRMNNLKSMLFPFCQQKSQKDREVASAVRNAIAMLPPNQGQAVLLRALDGTPYHVIAAILGCSEVTARSHFSKGKVRLAKILAELGIST